ncbi:hypothetical protein XELAEV_18041257mg [Xenopus laevis]|uniref:Uncharacterized protein n=1 Tax=Xenopus laevis TaxID=8355 RepID=A0A974C2F0_XENLA|nr:hypothetical protein XELAEV_18041257mg [Xenopus laevis]
MFYSAFQGHGARSVFSAGIISHFNEKYVIDNSGTGGFFSIVFLTELMLFSTPTWKNQLPYSSHDFNSQHLSF